ncbi:autotransporter outer membrane beta-barrel domain-containing protein [Cupriavidus sp. SW-Y-13]|uniref:autotransporter family protein n=1 Tax=Cupriavidus sp. SW-Y-13 TaxID=2653854 RepID=UPI001365C944|nr:autotransporter outer membrane beta-barrel domain-containing protein [Cupriavidus sp. SW-Y-13]
MEKTRAVLIDAASGGRTATQEGGKWPRPTQRHARRQHRQTLASGHAWLVLAGGLAGGTTLFTSIASAASYTVSSSSGLTQAVATANTDGDDNTDITLSQNITTASGTVFDVGTNPTTLGINTSGSTLTLNGPGTVWNTGSYFYFGISGGGGLTVSNGAQLRIQDGPSSSSPGILSFDAGALEITGSGSALTTSYLAVGRGGDATIALTNGGQLTTRVASIGEGPGTTAASTITVLVDGPGTRWNTGTFEAGGATNSVDVTVSNGAVIQAADSRIGINGAGSLLVDGIGSQFAVSGSLSIGAFSFGSTPGQGVVTVSDGGLVSALKGVIVGVDNGTTAALTVNSNGVLQTSRLRPGNGTATVTFDNGTLRATTDSTPKSALIDAFAPGAFTIGAGGMYIDSNGFDVTASTVMSGVGGLTKQGAGTLKLMNANTYAGTTNVQTGILQAGAVNTFSPKSAVAIASAGTIDLAGSGQIVAGLSNAGVVTMGSGTAPGTVLTVNGNYVGNGGTMVINTVLGADNSPSDKLVVNGNTAGQTGVKVVNAGGLGAQTTGNGIQLIQVTGTSNGTFNLLSPVAAGAYHYKLVQNGVDNSDGDWYLRSSLRPETVVDSTIGSSVSTGGLALMSKAAARGAGAIVCTDEDNARTKGAGDKGYLGACSGTLWARIIGQLGNQGGSASNANGTPAYDYGLYGIQTGIDLVRTASDLAGLYFGYGRWDSTVRDIEGGRAGRVAYDAYAVGVYWTHLYGNGLYTDLAVQEAWYGNLKASTHGGSNISTSGNSTTAQAEAGYQFGLGHGWAITPKLSLIYQRVSIGSTADSAALISFGPTNELYGRLGARVSKDWTATNNDKTQLFGEFSLWSQLGDRNAKTTFTNLQGNNPTTTTSLLGGSWGQFKVGVNSQITKKINAFVAIDSSVSLDHTGYSIGGHFGIKYVY